MKEIKLSRGKVAIVDDEDFELLSEYKWHANPGRGTFYAVTTVYSKEKKCRPLLMHRLIMEVTKSKVFIDHKNRNGLDNRRENLRKATRRQNNTNVKPRGGDSKYIGVSLNKPWDKWRATIGYNYRKIHIGYFSTETEAALAYNKVALEINGEFASLNIIT